MSESLEIVESGLFRKDLRRLVKRNVDLTPLWNVLRLLANRQTLPVGPKDHALIGNYRGYRECHVANDWLLVYKVDGQSLILVAFRTGTHSDLF